ncbi:MAG: hypothetical protein IIC46_10185 [Planctomycetes bacterium]|nr:hypothetical protein [Planctomycetota bacterium]
MKIGILSESEVDEAAYKILVESILGHPVDLFKDYQKRGGWSQAKKLIRPIILDLHYSGADGFVFVGDSDSTPPHIASHYQLDEVPEDCRLCEIRRLARSLIETLPARSGQPQLKVAVGMATPAIEAWLLSGIDAHCTETRFRDDHSNGRLTRQTRLDLKIKKYGSLHASSDIKMRHTLENANRIAEDLDGLQQRFQFGFGHLRNDLAQW